jgi:putative phage-type endonuclease
VAAGARHHGRDRAVTAILIPAGSEAEWLEARRKGVTASEIAIVMGLSPYSSPYALYWQKLGQLPEQAETDAMALGKHMESYVADRFAERHQEFHLSGDGRQLYAHPDRPWQMATPDRMVRETCIAPVSDHNCTCLNDPIAVLECKIDGGSDEWGDDGSDEIPVHYRCQVLWQMDVMGVGTAFVACLLWNRRQVRVYELAMDDAARADLKLMREEARCFLDRIDLQDPPDVDWRPATATALKHLHPSVEDRDVPISTQLATRYMAACRNLKTAEQKKARYENQIREQIGDGRRAVDPGRRGQVIARREVYDLPEKTITRKATTVNRLVAVKPKEPKS